MFFTSKKGKLETVNVGKLSSKNITTSDFFTNSGNFIKSHDKSTEIKLTST